MPGRLPSETNHEYGCDGTYLLHVSDWQAAVAETVRVAKDWRIFHRTPVSTDPTTLMAKLAYGVNVIEWRFNEPEFVELIHSHGCELTSALPIVTRARIGVTGTLSLVTYLFRKEPPGPARAASSTI